MIPSVRRTYLFPLAVVILLCGCHSSGRSGSCALIERADLVVVHHHSQEYATATDRVITNPEQIRRLIAFANNRRRVSQPSTYTMADPLVTATFYEEGDFVGAIGLGSNFFFRSCMKWRGIRSATDSEIRDFKQLLEQAN